MNNCIFSGNLGNDPEIFYSQDGNPMASFNLAFKSGKKTGWIKVASFQKLAEIVEQHLKKGNRVVVSGSLNQEQWESEGTKRTSFKLIAVKTPPPLITRSVGVCEKSLSVNNNEKEMKRLS